ncbi:3-hydroxyacyl-CoA dehydrogenase NAD-binding domain-containing protein [Tumebacillus lipolyticus]|uniref:3-hydroxyacyl-CoA dehydrogenase NAD-binding domain-containing protein n=1 Tax=Tumebacillus lipolyticus TaxID=1280370 RepID=A0ABW5A3K9_9BACL
MKAFEHPLGVIGAGTMGIGIAQAAAQAGYEVLLYDLSEETQKRALGSLRERLERQEQAGKRPAGESAAVIRRIRPINELEQLAQAVLVIEAVPEEMALKQELFAQVERVVSDSCVLASNTSSLPITALAGKLERPERMVGLHFFNPVPSMRLVEVIEGLRTGERALWLASLFAESLGKTTVSCQDTPGFLVNRVARSFYGEALRLLQEGVADVETIDRLAMEEGRFRMGPFRLMDLIGIDVNLAVSQSLYEATFGEPRYRPNPVQARLVQAGALGRKAGRGFYRYDD